jgi:hypothetical protein
MEKSLSSVTAKLEEPRACPKPVEVSVRSGLPA